VQDKAVSGKTHQREKGVETRRVGDEEQPEIAGHRKQETQAEPRGPRISRHPDPRRYPGTDPDQRSGNQEQPRGGLEGQDGSEDQPILGDGQRYLGEQR